MNPEEKAAEKCEMCGYPCGLEKDDLCEIKAAFGIAFTDVDIPLERVKNVPGDEHIDLDAMNKQKKGAKR